MPSVEAKPLRENLGIAFEGGVAPMSLLCVMAGWAERWIERPERPNPDGRSNRDVLHPLVYMPSRYAGDAPWVIDFGIGTTEDEARAYVEPFDYVDREIRIKHRPGDPFWLLRVRPPDYAAIARLPRFVATSRLANPRIFVWAAPPAEPAEGTLVFARDDDAFFGVLQSSAHRAWQAAVANPLRYELGVFESFPRPPGLDAAGADAPIARAAAALDASRERWVAEERARTEHERVHWSDLYDTPPAWLTAAHRALDEAVLDAYGLDRGADDAGIVAHLVRLRDERLAAGG